MPIVCEAQTGDFKGFYRLITLDICRIFSILAGGAWYVGGL